MENVLQTVWELLTLYGLKIVAAIVILIGGIIGAIIFSLKRGDQKDTSKENEQDVSNDQEVNKMENEATPENSELDNIF